MRLKLLFLLAFFIGAPVRAQDEIDSLLDYLIREREAELLARTQPLSEGAIDETTPAQTKPQLQKRSTVIRMRANERLE